MYHELMSGATDSPLRVLVVEDNPVIMDLFGVAVERLQQEQQGGGGGPMQQALAPAGPLEAGATLPELEIHEAADGSEAFQMVSELAFDLVVTDLYVPVLSGLELIRRIREMPERAATRILAISASIQDARSESLAAGADWFLQKPLRLVDLLDALRWLLKLKQP